MSKRKFTPGPHYVIGDELQYVNGDLYAVIQTPRAAIDIIAPQVMKDEHMANARLYAAAPDLYEALKLWIYKARFFSPEALEYDMAWKQAVTALERAEGKK